MKQWISRFRAQRARVRMRQAERSLPGRRAMAGWNAYVSAVLAGFLAWGAALSLLGTSKGLPTNLPEGFGLAGNAILLLVGLLIAAMFLHVVDAGFLRSGYRRLILLLLLSLCTLVPVRILLSLKPTASFLSPSVFLFPLALAPLLAHMLLNRAAAIAVGLWTAFAAAVLAERSFIVLTAGLIATGVVVCTAGKVRKRSQVFHVGLMVGIAQVYVVIAVAALTMADAAPRQADTHFVLRHALASLASGALSSLAALLVLPLFEGAFGVTTDITLLELSDLGHPLLQRLAMEAPGTYHHSLMTANLAQAAADEIGANALLARVCSYFHDIGKLSRPDLFTENIRAGENPHDELSPHMSALLITSHVKEGISLALLSRLPRLLVDAVQQHHGTSLVSYFHRKAMDHVQSEQQEGSRTGGIAAVQEGDFRYPGPKPKTRETAIVMLADSIEAASRSLSQATPHHLQNLVDEVVGGKLQDGQLDMSGMTLDEVNRLKTSFLFSLSNMLHSRVVYPKNERHRQ